MEPLKNHFGPAVAIRLAQTIAAVHPGFPAAAFLADALAGFDELELMPRGRHLARALRRHLPADPEQAMAILVATLGPPLAGTGGAGMAPFFYLPHVLFVGEFGLDHFEAAMAAQHALTQRFTAEFSIRPFLTRYPEATLARLRQWAADPSPHVRRLVSEGTRPRLPWAPRLPQFQADPGPVLELLELLKDDPAGYVRRSVANNLNDIGKDHPDRLVATARRWLEGATANRRRLVAHALRSAVKGGEAGALAVLGFAAAAPLRVEAPAIVPAVVRVGAAVRIAFDLVNPGTGAAAVVADLRIHFVKARGGTSPKVFKLRQVALGPGERVALGKTVSLAVLSTRRPHPGHHRVEAWLNGQPVALGGFDLVAGDADQA